MYEKLKINKFLKRVFLNRKNILENYRHIMNIVENMRLTSIIVKIRNSKMVKF